MSYSTPFVIKDGTIFDATGKKVKLWGVNYYTPFNHNYFNIEELGKDHFAAIDEDIRHFKLLGIDFIRMHLFDREITDRVGRIVENKHMRVFDYLIDQCAKNGIYLMLTPITWWNSIENQLMMEQYYAYWHIGSQEAFGFANYYSIDSLIWDPEALACQKTYLETLFDRKNSFSGKKLADYGNVISIELANESLFPEYSQIKGDFNLAIHMGYAIWSRGEQRLKLVGMWRDYRAAHPEVTDDQAGFNVFVASLVRRYHRELWGVVDHYFANRVIKAQFMSYNGILPKHLKAFADSKDFQALTMNIYLNANSFNSDSTDSYNHLALAEKLYKNTYEHGFGDPMPRIAYEFDAPATQNGYPLAAIAAIFAKCDVQLAAYFTYTPYAVAAWNPGWLVHFLNVAHTPSRAACFAASGEVFRQGKPSDDLVMETEEWHGKNYGIQRKQDFVYFKTDTVFRYSNSNDLDLGDVSRLEAVSGRGTSKFAQSNSNGCYFLTRQDAHTWQLDIFPGQRFLGEPGRGKSTRGMANRYVNCLREPPVSQLTEEMIRFKLQALHLVACKDAANGTSIPVAEDGTIAIRAGRYLLTVMPR